MKKIIALLCLLCLLLVAIIVYVQVKPEAEATPAPVLKVGTEAGYPPYEFKVDIDGKEQLVGFDIAFAKYIAAELGQEVEIVDMAFDTLLLELNQGRVDIVIAGLSPTPERAEVVELSDIYYLATQSIVTTKENAAKYSTYESLDGCLVGAQQGTIQEAFILEYLDSEIITNDKIDNLILELKTGRIDAVVIETPVAQAKLSAHPDLAIAQAIPAEHMDASGNVVAVKKGNVELVEKINAMIEEVTTDGTFDSWVVEANDLQAKYLG